jgi:catalase (peroxidase I)
MRLPGRGTSSPTGTRVRAYAISARKSRPRSSSGRTPPRRRSQVGRREGYRLKAKILASTLSIPPLVKTAWAAAASFRGSDKRLAPQKDWEVIEPAELAKVIQELEAIQRDFNGSQSGGKKVSLADLIVLGGGAAIEAAAKKAGHDVKVPFSPGRADASQEQTNVEAFEVLEPVADGFRNYLWIVGNRPVNCGEYERSWQAVGCCCGEPC